MSKEFNITPIITSIHPSILPSICPSWRSLVGTDGVRSPGSDADVRHMADARECFTTETVGWNAAEVLELCQLACRESVADDIHVCFLLEHVNK